MNFTSFRLNGWTDLSDRLQVGAMYENTWKDYTRSDYYTRSTLNINSYFRNKVVAQAQYRLTDKFNLTAGGWAEFIHLKSDDKTDNQVPVGGNFMAYYQLIKKNWMRLTYDCSVEYPDQSLSSDYGYFTDSLTWTGGNPSLRTNVMHNIACWIDLWWCFNLQTDYVYSPNRFATIAEVREGTLPGGSCGQYAAFISQITA